MIYEAFLAPTEFPTTSLELKKALLTYDKVYLSDPGDRDIIPPQVFMQAAFGMPLPFGFAQGDVRVLGKIDGYDDGMQELAEEAKLAIREGLVEFVSCFDRSDQGKLFLGAVPTGGYPLNPAFVLHLYRHVARRNEFLLKAIEEDFNLGLLDADLVGQLAMSGTGDGSFNDDPKLPNICTEFVDTSLIEPATQVARARLAAVIKFSGFCESKSMVPVFNGSAYGGIVRLFSDEARRALDAANDQSWSKRTRAMSIAHDEFLDALTLEKMPMDEVLKLRTKAWGQQAEARDRMWEAIAEISASVDDANYDDVVRQEFREYLKKAREVESERQALNFKISCESGEAALGGILALGAAQQVMSPLQSVAATLLAGGVWSLQKAKTYVPELTRIREKEHSIKRGYSYSIHNFFQF